MSILLIATLAVLVVALIVALNGWYRNRQTIAAAKDRAAKVAATATAAASYFVKKANEPTAPAGSDMRREIQASMQAHLDEKTTGDAAAISEGMKLY